MAWLTCRPVEYPCDAKCGDDENPWPAVNISADPSGACADDACKGAGRTPTTGVPGWRRRRAPAARPGSRSTFARATRGDGRPANRVRGEGGRAQLGRRVDRVGAGGGEDRAVVPDLAGDVTVVVFGTTSLDVSWKGRRTTAPSSTTLVHRASGIGRRDDGETLSRTTASPPCRHSTRQDVPSMLGRLNPPRAAPPITSLRR